MNVLVTAASREGATYGIAEAIGRTLRARGLDATVTAPDEVVDVAAYDGFVVGSAVYMGRWLEPATAFVHRLASTLSGRPVWLFSSGPVGDPRRRLAQKMTADPVELPELLALTKARGHRIFPGRISGQDLRGPQRLSLLIFRGFDGDWRDWPAVERWADEIADSLARERVETTATAG